jgi:DUF971 family protein
MSSAKDQEFGRMKIPFPVAVNVSKADRLFEVRWDGDHLSRLKLDDLRFLCECATCKEDKEKRKAAPKSRELPILGTANRAEIATVNHVGRYAFGVGWQDGHQSIYTYHYLFECCPCAECKPKP